MYGKIIDAYGTEDCTYVCECPVCKTNYNIKPGCESDQKDCVLIETYNKDHDSLRAEGEYLLTINDMDIIFYVRCQKCGVNFKSIVQSKSVCSRLANKK